MLVPAAVFAATLLGALAVAAAVLARLAVLAALTVPSVNSKSLLILSREGIFYTINVI